MIDGEEVDLGRVGDVVEVDPTPVLGSPSPPDASRSCRASRPTSITPGQSLNVNADAAAAALAVSLHAAQARDPHGCAWALRGLARNRDSLVSHLTSEALIEMLPKLESGMIPKMRACLDAVEGGVDAAAIIDGRVPHSVLVELFTSRGIGTRSGLGKE